MARLTDDMTRLVAEINGHHLDRDRLLRGMRDATADLKRSVAQTLSRAHAARLAQTRGLQTRLRGFARHLQDTTTGLRAAVATDLAGAHGAWAGGSKADEPIRRERGHDRPRAKA